MLSFRVEERWGPSLTDCGLLERKSFIQTQVEGGRVEAVIYEEKSYIVSRVFQVAQHGVEHDGDGVLSRWCPQAVSPIGKLMRIE